MTPLELSLIKAGYFRTILNLARSAEEHVALRLISSLVNDAPTPGVQSSLREAEIASLEATKQLNESLRSREINAVAAWNGAIRAVQQWLSLFPGQSN